MRFTLHVQEINYLYRIYKLQFHGILKLLCILSEFAFQDILLVMLKTIYNHNNHVPTSKQRYDMLNDSNMSVTRGSGNR